jgi:hypothetical protein
MKFTLDTKTWNHFPPPMSKYQWLSLKINPKALT